MQTAKQKIDIAVKEYIKLFPQEYAAFQKGRTVKLSEKIDKWASTKQRDSAIERHLFDLPERLHSAIHSNLTDVEREWFTASGEFIGKFEGIHWFMLKYPNFCITDKF